MTMQANVVFIYKLYVYEKQQQFNVNKFGQAEFHLMIKNVSPFFVITIFIV